MKASKIFARTILGTLVLLALGSSMACRKETVQLVYKPCPGAELVRDVDDNAYPTVHIGTRAGFVNQLDGLFAASHR